MADIQWGPWSGVSVLQGSPTGFPAASTHSAWSLSASDLEMLQKASCSAVTKCLHFELFFFSPRLPAIDLSSIPV